MKIAPLMRAYAEHPNIDPVLIHTGQHYDKNMSDLFFHQLGIPEPDVNLGVGSGSHAVQTAEIMQRFEPIVLETQADAVLVVGDVNSTVACGLVAVKLGIGLIHVEAGLRSGDRTMPEEINRVVTDSISDLLFVTEKSGMENLRREGVPEDRIHFVGNVMIDTLRANREKAEASTILETLAVSPGEYLVATLHRPSNVDDPAVFSGILDAFDEIQRELPIVLPMHPRTRGSLMKLDLWSRIEQMSGLKIVDPLGYLDFLKLIANATAIMTDSGGIQEESTVLGVTCLTLRENTERPITIEQGTNTLVGTDPSRILAAYHQCRRQSVSEPPVPDLWDGRAAERIAQILAQWKPG